MKNNKVAFDFYDFDQQPIEKDVRVGEWQTERKNTVGRILVGYNHKKRGLISYVDVYAELTLDEYYDSVKGVPREILYKWDLYGGRGIPAFLPLYAYYNKTDLNDYTSGLFLIDSKFKCGTITDETKALFDTGASMTHISSRLWKESGMAEELLHKHKDICNLLGFFNVDDFGKVRDTIAETKGEDSFLLPLKEFSTGVGDGTRRRTYQTRLDELIIYNNKLGSSSPVTLSNIDVRIIESPFRTFVIGENVINYLTTQMGPIGNDFNILIDFTEDGKCLMDKHRKTKNINAMTDMYILDEQFIPSNVFQNKKNFKDDIK